MPKVDDQGNCLSKICSLGKKSTLPRGKKVGIFLTTNQLICFRLTLTESFARRIHIYACTSIHKYRDIHTFMHICMNSYIQTKHPPLSHIHVDHKQWENDINR